jgi:hypothetical protein
MGRQWEEAVTLWKTLDFSVFGHFSPEWESMLTKAWRVPLTGEIND